MRLMVVSAFWVAGVAAALQWDIPAWAIGLFLVWSLALALLFWLNGWRLLLPIALSLGLLGALRAELMAPPGEALLPWIGVNNTEVRGVVVEEPEAVGITARFRLRVEQISSEGGWHGASGDVQVIALPSSDLVSQRGAPYLRYGDRLSLVGALDEPPALPDFDYREYMARQGVHAVMNQPRVALVEEGLGSPVLSAVYAVRRSLARAIVASLPEPQASLAQTLLLGIRSGVPASVAQAFRDTGTSHLLAISGLHVGVVLGLSLPLSVGLLGRRRNLYLLLPLGIVWLYAALSGFSPSAERAAIMASLFLLAVALGRQRSAFTALGFAAALMVALDPPVLYDISFQLSFAAMTGILLLWPPLERATDAAFDRVVDRETWWTRPSRWVASAVAVSLAATLATLPLLAFSFHRIALLGIPATVLALPALPLVLVLSLGTALAGLMTPVLGQVVGWLAWLPLSYMLGMVETLARLPQTVIHLEVSGFLVWGYYGVAAALLILFRLGWRRLLIPLRWWKRAALPQPLSNPMPPMAQAGVLLSLAAGVALLWTANASLPDGKLHVTFIDVGQGDATFVQTPEGQQLLVDGGRDPRLVLEALGERMPFWDRSLDVLVLSHSHEDHLAGLVEVLRRYRVALVIDNGFPDESPAREVWRTAVQAEGARVLVAQQGQVVKLGESVTLEVFNPPDPPIGGTPSDLDNNSTVVRLRHGSMSLLLTGDLQAEGEASLIDRGVGLESTVLKVAHHGSKTSSTQQFLEAVRPQLAVVSVGEGNPYCHPADEVMGRLNQITGSMGRVFRTDERGAITLTSDGQSITVQTQLERFPSPAPRCLVY
ncbi:MAG: DNA internalization-related competence protein ComEC/Rec2 [Chloroflexi bacterium]|nr:DNA internalization-related competence protein ComEC/Rec2 [Chloroflexota bacterium]